MTSTGTPTMTLTVSGSTTVEPIAIACAEYLMNNIDGLDIQISGTGSATGLACVNEGTCDIGMSSSTYNWTAYPDLKVTVIALDGIAIIVHPTNNLTQLTMEQLKAIYNGTINDWALVGSNASGTINNVNRDTASGTRNFFWKTVMDQTAFEAGIPEMNSNGAVRTYVATNPDAIGYVGLGYVDITVKDILLSEDGIDYYEANSSNILSGNYPIARSLFMMVKGDMSPLEWLFINFILSETGQDIVEAEGFVRLP
ncbi:MAG: phosphate ABC transporter substrate-binding protein [Candidatus Helarchaeota archaeon]